MPGNFCFNPAKALLHISPHDRIVNPLRRVVEKLPRKIFIEAGRIGLQNGFDFVGDTQRFLHEVSRGCIAHFSTRLAEIRRE